MSSAFLPRHTVVRLLSYDDVRKVVVWVVVIFDHVDDRLLVFAEREVHGIVVRLETAVIVGRRFDG